MPNLSLRKLWRKRSATISQKDPTYKVIYLGNVLTGWAKGEGCVDKPLSTLWRNHCQSNRTSIIMKVTICSSGLQAVTREHGLTEYWAHRVTYCTAHPAYPKVFCWVYRHEGRRLKQELRCHAVLCYRNDKAQVMASQLKERLSSALHEFRREKVIRQNARLSLMHAIYDNAALPSRKVLLSTGTTNYRPPLERSKSAPKLGSIEETIEEEEEEEQSPIEEEDSDETSVRGQNFHASPVGSLAISETMSDIVQYGNRTTELGTSLALSRSTSQRGKSVDQDDEFASSEDCVSSVTCNGGELTTKINITDSHLTVNRQSSCSNSLNTSSHKEPMNFSSKPTHNMRPPVIRRRYLRSISVDTGSDNGDIDDFDDSDDSGTPVRSPATAPPSHVTLRIAYSSSQPCRVDDSADEELCSSLTSTDTTETVLDRILPAHSSTYISSVDHTEAVLERILPTHSSTLINIESSSRSSSGVDFRSSTRPKTSHASSIEVDPESQVLSDPQTVEDTITLINCLSHSFSRQMSLPAESHHPDESLTSDQPESLGSHCDSCSSSCGGCSDAGGGGSDAGGGGSDNGHCVHADRSSGRGISSSSSGVSGRLLGVVVIGNLENLGNLSNLSAQAEEADNISEESGYAEDKDFLQCAADNSKILNAQ